jgi:hypothetical protein
MQRRLHAALGATTLTTSWLASAPCPVDAKRSFELVGTMSESAAATPDPVTAARRWLADPSRGSRLDPLVRSRAEQAIDIAEAHMRSLDELARDLSLQVDFDGGADPARIAHLDQMATELTAFSDRLRTLLDPTHVADDAAKRLERGLEAASTGGLRALVDSI